MEHKIEIKHSKHDNLWVAWIDGKETNHLFYTAGEAAIYAGLFMSVGANDASYLSRYISAMIRGLNNEKN